MFTPPAVDLVRSRARLGLRRRLRPLPQPRARAARVRRRAAGRRARRGDRHAGRRARSARWSRSPATRCSRRRTARASTRARHARLHGRDRHLPQRDDAPRARDPAADVGARARSHYDLGFHALAVRNVAKYSPPVFAARARQRHDWRDLPRAVVAPRPAAAGSARSRPRARARRCAGSGPRRSSTSRCAPAATACAAAALSLAKLRGGAARHRPRPARAAPAGRLRTPDRRIALAPRALPSATSPRLARARSPRRPRPTSSC